MKNSNSMLNNALRYVRSGFSIIPLTPAGKKPLLKSWKKYQEMRADEATIRSWWKKWPNANIGCVTGAISGVDVLDLDGSGALAMLEKELGTKLPKSIRSKTGKGMHIFFKHSEAIKTGAGLLKDGMGNSVDIRANGAYVVLPPSVHPNGGRYEWI